MTVEKYLKIDSIVWLKNTQFILKNRLDCLVEQSTHINLLVE